jgi:transposase
MPQVFIACDRDQEMLLPPSLLDWVPEDHLVWTILGAVEELDLSAFYGVYRADGHGRPAYEPSVMVALLLYSYARGNRSSRGIERECRENVAYKLITAQRVPDHSTVADFRRRHEAALADLFTGVLGLCEKVGLVSVGLIAVDGMKLHASASQHSNRDYRRIVVEILAEADRADREEDERFGEKRGDELPEQLQSRECACSALREALRDLDAEREQDRPGDDPPGGAGSGSAGGLEAGVIVPNGEGRRGWVRGARQQLDGQRAERSRAVPRSRAQRLREGQRLLEHRWAVPLRDAIASAGGFGIGDGFISPLDLVEIGLVAADEAAALDASETAGIPGWSTQPRESRYVCCPQNGPPRVAAGSAPALGTGDRRCGSRRRARLGFRRRAVRSGSVSFGGRLLAGR